METTARSQAWRRTAIGLVLLATPFVTLVLVSPHLGSWWGAGLTSILVLSVMHVALEKLAPRAALPVQLEQEVLRDAWHGASSFATSIGGLIGGWLLTDAGLRALTSRTTFPAESTAVTFAMAAAVMLAGDLVFYWHHRLSHASNGFWWRIHAVHHSIQAFTTTHGARAHPLEPPLVYAVYGAGGALLAFPLEPTLMGAIVGIFITANQHVNVDADLGPLRHVFVFTDHHRWHHDIDAFPSCNYANVFSFWDRLFGTYRNPGRFTGTLGIRGVTIPSSLKQQLGAMRDEHWAAWERAAAAEAEASPEGHERPAGGASGR